MRLPGLALQLDIPKAGAAKSRLAKTDPAAGGTCGSACKEAFFQVI